jgi:hypothetical protein
MADTPPDEDMDTTPGPSTVPGGSQDLKDNEDKSSEREEEEAVTLDLQPKGTEVFECPGDCKENCSNRISRHPNDRSRVHRLEQAH